MELPNLALIGAGLFVRSQYVPRFRDISHLMSLKIIWSRTKEAAEHVVSLVDDFAPNAKALWGEEGLKDVLDDKSIHGVVVVVAAQAQAGLTVQALRAGKHVLQEKPASSTVSEGLALLNTYRSLHTCNPCPPILAVAENYRFEPGLTEAAMLVEQLGQLMIIEVIAEAPMNNANPYFFSHWRKVFDGGFTLDMGVHFIAGLRMVAKSEVMSVAALSRHVDQSLPPPDNISAVMKLQNGCIAVFVMSMSSTSRKLTWRVVGSRGTVEAERAMQAGQHGYTVTIYPSDGKPSSTFHAFSGVSEELKSFCSDIVTVTFKGLPLASVDRRSCPAEGVRDVAVIEAILRSCSQNGAWTDVQAVS